jgi:hypothetical protein
MTNGIGNLPTVTTARTIGPRPPLPRRTIPLTARPLARELADQGWEQAA